MHPPHTEEARPLLELNVQQAIASILQKPQWWVKWHDQKIRDKWMSEVELQFILKTFKQSLERWSHGLKPIWDLEDLLEQQDDANKHQQLRYWLQGVVTEFKKDKSIDEYDDDEEEEEGEESEEEDDDEEEDGEAGGEEGNTVTKKRKREKYGPSDDDCKFRKRLCALEAKVELRESYPTLKWTFNQLLLHERLSAIPVEDWTTDSIKFAVDAALSVNDPSIAPQAAEFVLAICRGVSVEDALPATNGSKLLSRRRRLKLKLHCEKIHQELGAVQSYVEKYVELMAMRMNLTATTDPARVVMCPAGIDAVWISNNIIPDEVAMKFKTEVAVLENVPDEEKDWHPHSEEKVLDLVHPSLFCCVLGHTLKSPSALHPLVFSSPAEQMQRLMFTGSAAVEKPRDSDTEYQWIPTDFLVAGGGEPGEDGDIAVRVLSYINNLHPDQHAALYDSIGEIFGRFVPLFERMLGDQAAGLPRSEFSIDMESHKEASASHREDCEKPKYEGGTWHIEGSPAERIVGTGIYYFGCENIKNSCLSFRVEVDAPLCQHNDHDGAAEIYGLVGSELLVQVLGSVETLESRCVVFPNTLQHQVQPFELEDPTKPGARKILAFFLVDPTIPIPSTSIIPPQQEEWMKVSLDFAFIGGVKQNIRLMLPRGMTLEEAKQHRLKLMQERAVPETPEYGRLNDPRYFSLCEH